MCGIIGVFNHPKAAELVMLGLFAEQHRGQESCGMAVSDGRAFRLRKKMGLVKQVFTPEVLKELDGTIAIGHVRYPTRGTATEFNSQPHLVETLEGPSYALVSNGDIINYDEIRKRLEEKNVYFKSDNDCELILRFIVYKVEKEGRSVSDSILEVMQDFKGAYSAVLAVRDKLYMFRDPFAIRPMVWGKRADGVVVTASESCALDILGITKQEEVGAGEIIIVDDKEIKRIRADVDKLRNGKKPSHCIFELVYFSRPDSHDFGEDVYSVREAIGRKLAQVEEYDVDIVVPVPDSANFIAVGYSREKNIPYEMGLIRNHYVGRTFIKPDQTIRDEGVQQKFNTLPNFFEGKRVALIDDSIVRGSTIKNLVRMIKYAGAKEVHLRIGSPQVKYPCYYGIDTPNQGNLIANKLTLDEIRDFVDADSIKHITLSDLRTTVAKPDEYCYACFNADYPVGVENEPK
ncbi:MAG: amidophosphoribosyltransferase [Candidatus Cloacimonadia bacterium]